MRAIRDIAKFFEDKDLECSIVVVNWAEINKINDTAAECLTYLGNHLSDDMKVYAVFGGGENTLNAVPLPV